MSKRFPIVVALLAIPLAGPTFISAAEQDGNATQASIVLKDMKAAPGTVRLSKLIGTETQDPKGRDVGKIKDVVIDPSRDQVAYIVLAQRGVLDEKLIALPYKAMKFGSAAEDHVSVVLSNDILDKAPGFDDSKWPTEANADYYRSLDNYYNTQLATMADQQQPTTQPSAMAQPAAAQVGEARETQWSRRATKLQGRDVITPSGESLGKINDIVLDQRTGNVIYAAVEDTRGNLHAVPLSTFSLDLNDEKMVLDTTRDQLKGTPSFDEDRWPAKADPRWSKEVSKQ